MQASQQKIQLILVSVVQEANRLLPGRPEILSLCSKAWSDVTYLDEIHNIPYKETLTDEQKREVNTKAISYCEEVCLCTSVRFPWALHSRIIYKIFVCMSFLFTAFHSIV